MRQQLISLILVFAFIPAVALGADALEWDGYAVAEDISNLHGGIQGGSIIITAGKLTAFYNTQRAGWWRGGQFAVGVLGIGQTHLQNLYTGAIQTPSGYTGVPEVRLTDLAYQQTFNDKFMARAGIMDFDDYLNVTEFAENILNSAFSNTIALSYNAQVATYPYPGFGALAQLGTKKLNLTLGVFQGNPQHQRTVFNNGQMLVAELTSGLDGNNRNTEYILKAGIWDYQQNLEYVGTTNHGVYFIAQAKWPFMQRILSAALNVGFNPKKFDTVTDSVAACFSIYGVFKPRPIDSLNFAGGRAWLNGAEHAETFYEVNYTIQLTDDWKLIPDVQYFIHPGGQYHNAWVSVLRLEYTLPPGVQRDSYK